MRISKQSRREAKGLFQACLVNGLLDEKRVREMIQQVLKVKPRGYLATLSHLERLVKLDLERRTAKIESAVALPAELQRAVQEKLERSYGKGLNTSFVQNPALIGGMRIKVGSDVYDGSVRARLTTLQESFSS